MRFMTKVKKKEYRVDVAIKNGYLYQLMEIHGIDSIMQLSKKTEVQYTSLIKYANLQEPAYNKNGELKSAVKKLCRYFDCKAEDIFPHEHLFAPLAENKVSKYYGKEQIDKLIYQAQIQQEQQDPLFMLERDQDDENITGFVSKALSDCLNDREKQVIRMRFGLNKKEKLSSQDDVGLALNVSGERVRQIEHRAMRKMRDHIRGSGIDGVYDIMNYGGITQAVKQ
jgi:RNA polymerase sigma factor (sigma-70 family)